MPLLRRLREWGMSSRSNDVVAAPSKTAYQCLLSGLVAHVHPESVLFQSGLPHAFVGPLTPLYLLLILLYLPLILLYLPPARLCRSSDSSIPAPHAAIPAPHAAIPAPHAADVC
jgi:hypothetical protein